MHRSDRIVRKTLIVPRQEKSRTGDLLLHCSHHHTCLAEKRSCFGGSLPSCSCVSTAVLRRECLSFLDGPCDLSLRGIELLPVYIDGLGRVGEESSLGFATVLSSLPLGLVRR